MPNFLFRDNLGFTLLELLISLTISVMVVVLLFMCFNIGVRAWERGEVDIEDQQSTRVVLSMIRHQMSSAMEDVELTDQEGRKFVMKGAPDSLQFVSQVAMLPENFGQLVAVEYHVEEDEKEGLKNLVLIEQPLLLRQTVGDMSDELDMAEPEPHVLFSGLHDAYFAYLSISLKGPEWKEEWTGASSNKLPDAVLLRIFPEDGQAPLPDIVARIEQHVR